ncbi:MAG: type II secretion system protein [Candidatus Omnitrophota bacterium]
MLRKNRREGFSLLELLVSVILIGIGVGAVSGLLTSGEQALKKTKNDAKAMSVAFAEKERLLAKSYDSLETGTFTGSTEGNFFNWQADVNELWQCATQVVTTPISGVKCIPFKEINVAVTYPDEGNLSTSSDKLKKVSLRNITPYPFVHLESVSMDSSCSGISPVEGNSCVVPGSSSLASTYVGDLVIAFDYPVAKDLEVFYNIATKVIETPGNEFEGIENIITQCYLDGVAVGQKTGTPILSQPSIANNIVVENVSSGSHTLSVKWYKDTGKGTVSIVRANLILLAFEPID